MLLRILIIAAVVAVIVLAWDFLAQMIMPPSARGEIAAELLKEAAEDFIEEADGARFSILELDGDHDLEITKMLYNAVMEKDSAAVSGEIIRQSDLGDNYPPSGMTLSNIGDDRRIGYLLAGAVLTETVFSWPGIGTYIVSAAVSSDYNALQGGLILIALTVVVVNLVVDLAYHYIDPRVRLEK